MRVTYSPPLIRSIVGLRFYYVFFLPIISLKVWYDIIML